MLCNPARCILDWVGILESELQKQAKLNETGITELSRFHSIKFPFFNSGRNTRGYRNQKIKRYLHLLLLKLMLTKYY